MQQESTLEEIFASYIQRHNLRKTDERFAILEKAKTLETHFDADTLHQAMESNGYHVSRSTVYNTLELLCKCGILRVLTFDPHQARYELANHNHLHLVCTDCGSVKDVEDNSLSDNISASKFPSFSSNSYSLTVYGLCSRCLRKKRKTSKGNVSKSDTN